MLRILTATRQEPLLEALAASLHTGASRDPLAPDLVVAERGTDRWLWQYLAEQHGIAANLRFEPPAGFLWRMLRHYFPDTGADNRFDAGPLRWRIAEKLPNLLAQHDFRPLAGYLAQDDGRKLHQLSARLAALFNDYLVYRPEMVVGWEKGKRATKETDEHWQQKLWQALVKDCGNAHRATLLIQFLNEPAIRRERPRRLPTRAAIFGIPALPPVYVQALVALGGHIDIDLYVFNPCREFWGDLVDPKKIARDGDGVIEGHDLSNRLLASWGQPVRHFISELYGHEAEHIDLDGEDEQAPKENLLGRLQHDIHALTETPATLATHDDSIRITSAWGTMREVEILHDELLGRFQRDATLKPRDILVMVPAIEQYAPMIEAVFGAADGERFIPWTLTDISRRSAHPVTAALEQLLKLPDSRFAASEVLGLLETPAIARRFRFDTDTLAALRQALLAANLHGDLDADARAARGLPAESTHSWQFALQRLFLGVAMAEQDAPVLGVLPEPAYEGQAAAALGRLQSFLDKLVQWQQRLSRPQVPDQWTACLYGLCADFFDADDDEQAVLDDVLKAAREFLDETSAGNFGEDLPPAVFRDDFLARLRAPASRGNLRSGGVTFCGMVPMRSLPFRVIAVLGLNNEHYPRQQRAPGFDLIARAPRAGDRSRRHDDRHLFLETLLSARDALYLSYTGRNPQDSSEREPSVLVRELLDQVMATHGGEDARKAITKQLLIEHPLQAFSPRYFTPATAGMQTLRSYDRDWLLPARAGHEAVAPPFCATPLPAREEQESPDIPLDELARFFEHPARGFLRRRFGISLFDQDTLFDDIEPFELDILATRALENELLAHRLDGGTAQIFRDRLLARGDLPQASFAGLAWQQLDDAVAPFAAALATALQQRHTLAVDLVVDTAQGPHRIHGRLPDVTPDGLVLHRVGKLRAKHRLSAWIQHLCLQLSVSGASAATRYFARGDKNQPEITLFNPVENPRALLASLVDLYLQARNQPLPLLPACSEALARHDDDPRKALKEATAAWEGDSFRKLRAEHDDEAVRIIFGNEAPPFDEKFHALALQVFSPLLAALDDA